MYEVKEPFWQLVDHWQTLITGLLALAAGVWTVWATIKSANREITTAQNQTKAAQQQTAAMREIERRRLAREGYAFHAMLEAAMRGVIEDVAAAREMPSSGASLQSHSMPAYAVRQQVKRAGFAELRTAFVRFGEQHTSEFLQLDKEIEDFAGQFMIQVNTVTGFQVFHGVNAGIAEQLDRIEQQATNLRGWAARGMRFCRDELAKDLL
jgi:hypothetical protein